MFLVITVNELLICFAVQASANFPLWQRIFRHYFKNNMKYYLLLLLMGLLSKTIL